MANSEQCHTNLEPSNQPIAAREEHGEAEIPIARRLRDREMLRKRREKAQEKDSAYWIYREPRIKKPRKGRGDKQGWGDQPAVEPKPVAELKVEPEAEPVEEPAEELEHVQPNLKPQEKAEPVAPKPAPPEPVQQEQSPALTTQGLVAGMPMGAAGGELAASSQDAVGDEELLNLAETEIPEDLNTPLDNMCQDNEYIPFLF
ncbi:major latex allergen Hev b 5-like [Strigops habroptila]|uniref:major latex allergen Hev b 5-like n=1 Tax=Strigops habroptila TaxID=2489341 RepID=UPI0011CEDBD7|nr:major latex allergen Hev b 5-like [Strigops habroptila]